VIEIPRPIARAIVPIGIGVIVLSSAGCDGPGATVRAENRDGEVHVLGTDQSDAITLRLQAGDPNQLLVDVGADGTAEFQFARDEIHKIVVRGFGGDDTIVADHTNGAFTDTEQTGFFGGDGDDTLVGSVGAEILIGDGGDDVIDGQQGADTLDGGAGHDSFGWDPGDGSDVVVGGAGSDELTFNGSGASETYELSSVGDHVRFTRDVANVVMDLNDVEALEVRAFSGTDVLRANDVTGTDLTSVTANFALFGGGDDLALDRVVVPVGLDLGHDGPTATVDGLGAQVRVVNGFGADQINVVGTAGADEQQVVGSAGDDVLSVTANGTDVAVLGATGPLLVNLTAVESLDVDLDDGADTFSATGNLAALIALDVDGGAGADTILGSNGADVLAGGDGADFVDGQQGIDTVDGGADGDTFQWDPGDGSDVLVGGAGSDRLAFNGSSANENFDVTAVGDHVRFARDIAAIALDLDDIEAIEVRALGGTDVLRPSDVTGTDLTSLTADFALFGGGDDGALDRVRVPLGVSFGHDGQAATVDGLGAQVRVVNGAGADQIHVVGTGSIFDVQPVVATDGDDAVSVVANGPDVAVLGLTGPLMVNLSAVESLDVDLGEGADSFATAGDVGALIALDVDGGAGADTIVGSNGPDVLAGGAGPDFIDGQQGFDVIDGDEDDDTFQWDPGDASDDLTGGAGSDRLAFNGSGDNENLDISRVGNRVRFARDLESVVVSFVEIESLDVRALGGTDVLGALELTGTDLVTVTADLALAGGGDDLAFDRVMVPLGVSLGYDGQAATVDGLGPQLRVVGAAGSDYIHVVGTGAVDVQQVVGTAGSDAVSVIANGTDVAVFGVTGPVMANLSSVESLDVDLGDGADTFSATGNLAALTALDVDGGAGADTILGSNGADVLAGGAGADFIDGQQAVDTVNGGADGDTFQWDPGDASDVLLGGAGSDRLVFNGSAANENYEVSAVGGHVRFTRDIAAIVLDLDDIEALDVRAFGGTDVLRAQDVTGTDLVAVTADFALFGGGDDLALDRVVVPVGLALGHDGPAATVDGLGAQVRVVGGFGADQINVVGTAGADEQSVVGSAVSDAVSVTANGADVAVSGLTGPLLVNLTAVESLDVDLGDGADTFSATGNLAALIALDVDGGPGADSILGSNGPDVLAGGDGADFVDGQQGMDTVDGGADGDTFQWDPGDGSDVLVGGAGTDRMVFNGSAINEIFEVSAVGGHVRFTRNIGVIALDLDGVEALDVRAVGNTDVLTIQDLSGTDLTTVVADLALFGGGVDGAVDQVVVNGTSAADTITVRDDGAAVVVEGLAATVRITGADPALDLLTVNGLDGDDTITATPGAGALIQLLLTP
jgi:Ca2+-binding RTX toxin-like protein